MGSMIFLKFDRIEDQSLAMCLQIYLISLIGLSFTGFNRFNHVYIGERNVLQNVMIRLGLVIFLPCRILSSLMKTIYAALPSIGVVTFLADSARRLIVFIFEFFCCMGSVFLLHIIPDRPFKGLPHIFF